MLKEAEAELQNLHTQKANQEGLLEKTNARIEALTKTYNAIAPLVGKQPIPSLKDSLINAGIDELKAAGISVAVRAILDAHTEESFNAVAVRDQLGRKGWSWDHYVNPLSTIYTVLTRLAESGAAKETAVGGKKMFYSAKRTPPPPGALLGRPKPAPPSPVGKR